MKRAKASPFHTLHPLIRALLWETPLFLSLLPLTVIRVVFWSQECLETAHICLPVKSLIFNEPAKVTPSTLMCCHPQRTPEGSINPSRSAHKMKMRLHNQIILLSKVYTQICPGMSSSSCFGSDSLWCWPTAFWNPYEICYNCCQRTWLFIDQIQLYQMQKS